MKFITLIVSWFTEVSRFCPRFRRRKSVEKPFLIIGHRGSPAAEVENTIPSFERALNENANALEMDICLTKDNIPIIYHDWDPDSMISRLRQQGFEQFMKYKPIDPPNEFDKPVNELTLQEVRKHYHFTLKENGNGEPVKAEIPTLEEFFAWSVGKESLKCIFLDIKVPNEQPNLVLKILESVQEFIKKYSAKFMIVHETAAPEVLKLMQEKYPDNNYLLDIEIPPGIILNPKKHSAIKPAIEKQNNFALMMRPRQVTVGSWSTYRRVVNNDVKYLMKLIKKNLEDTIDYLVCATISNRAEMKCLVKMGINGIMTDYPALLRTVAERNKREIA